MSNLWWDWWDEIDTEIYQDYLQSDGWQEIREEVADANNHKCKYCGRPDGFFKLHHVHHTFWAYLTLGSRNISLLEYVCPKCHKKLHRIE